MKNLLLCAGLACLLCACTEPASQMSVSQDARVLSGHWSGDLIEDTTLTVAGAGGGRVYALRTVDVVTSLSNTTSEVMAFTADNGTLLNSASLSGITSLAYRADGALLATRETAIGVAVLELDPVSLAIIREHPFGYGVLSRDGTAVLTADSRIDTTSWTPHPIPRSNANVPDPATSAEFSSDGSWRLDNLATRRIVNVSTGVVVDPAPQHTLICNTTGYGTNTVTFDHHQDGLAIGYLDGTVEIRDAQGQLQRVLIASNACIAGGVIQVSVFGDQLLVLAGMNGASEKLIGIDMSSGQATQYAVAAHQDGGPNWSSEPHLVSSGVAFSESFGITVNPHQRALRFISTAGQQWSVDRRALPISLDAQASYVSPEAYQAQGTVGVDGRQLNFQAQVVGYGGPPKVILKQANPPFSFGYQSSLSDASGVYGQLRGSHDSTAGQHVSIQRGIDGHAFYGTLQRQ